MTREEIIEALRGLPAAEQREVLRALEQSLGASDSPLAGASSAFWASRSIDELAGEQGIPAATALDAPVMPDWPDDETADDLIAYVRSQRDVDRGN